MKSVCIRSFSSPYFAAFGLYTAYSVGIRENTDQKNSEYGHFSRLENDLTRDVFYFRFEALLIQQ